MVLFLQLLFKSVGSARAQHLAGFDPISAVPRYRFPTGMVPFAPRARWSDLESATRTASPRVTRTQPCCSSPRSNQFSSHLLGRAESWPAAPRASWPATPLSPANAGAAAAAPPPAAPGASYKHVGVTVRRCRGGQPAMCHREFEFKAGCDLKTTSHCSAPALGNTEGRKKSVRPACPRGT